MFRLVCVSACVNLWKLPHAPLRWYRAMSCTMHHWPALRFTMQFCTIVHFGGTQRSCVLIRWCTRRFCMFVISSDKDPHIWSITFLCGLYMGMCVWRPSHLVHQISLCTLYGKTLTFGPSHFPVDFLKTLTSSPSDFSVDLAFHVSHHTIWTGKQ